MPELDYAEIRKAALAEMAGAACLRLKAVRVNLLSDPVWGVWTCTACGRTVAGLVTCNEIWCTTCTRLTGRGELMSYAAARRAAGRHTHPKGIVLPDGLDDRNQRVCRRLLVEEMDRITGVWRV